MQTTTQKKGIQEMQTIMQRKTDHPLGMALLVLIAVLTAALALNVAAGRASATEVTTPEQPPEQTGDSSVLEELPQATPAKDTRYLLSQGRTHEQYLYAVKNNIDNFWARSFYSAGKRYGYANLRLIYNNVSMKCYPYVVYSNAPLYCSADQTVYWAPLKRDWQNNLRIDEYGDFAVAYMMGHEMGHHVQYWSGIRLTQPYQELQADCLSGVWAYSQYYAGYMQSGDLQEALNLAWAWGGGDGSHGTKDQRYRAFKLGYDTGNTAYCTQYYLRSFSLTEDNTKPEITGLRPAGKTSDRTPAVRAVVRDAGGELAKNHVKLYLDGKQVSTASYDQESGKLRYVSGKVGFGKHTAKVVATDLGENTATEKWSFKVARKTKG
jgi:uncharacterized protein